MLSIVLCHFASIFIFFCALWTISFLSTYFIRILACLVSLRRCQPLMGAYCQVDLFTGATRRIFGLGAYTSTIMQVDFRTHPGIGMVARRGRDAGEPA